MHPLTPSTGKTNFQSVLAQELSQQLNHRNSVVLIGMKRVGISNFLRHYLSQPLPPTAQHHPERRIVVDLNHLVERSLYAFWVLTLKKVVDEIQAGDYQTSLQTDSRALFTQSIQLHDLFFTMHALQQLLYQLSQQGIWTTFFFLRFDRLREAMNPEFYANLKAMTDSVPGLTYVVTSYRPLYELAPTVFPQSSVNGFFHPVFVTPLSTTDIQNILKSLALRYSLQLNKSVSNILQKLAGGHVHYLHQMVLKIKHQPQLLKDPAELELSLLNDEAITLLSEEIFNNLTEKEQQQVTSLSHKQIPADISPYLLETGLIKQQDNYAFFSPVFLHFLASQSKRDKKTAEFTKKEYQFFEIVLASVGELVERDKIIEHVWPDEEEYGVSDWAVDRLASRVRRKLAAQKAHYKLETVITRGYKLVDIPPHVD